MKALDCALAYLRRNWSVIPLQPRGKRPIIGSWEEFQKRRATEEEVTAWFTNTPDANIGIVTGAVSGLAVIDIDGPTGTESAKSLSLPGTLQVRSGKGGHLYYSHPGSSVKTCAGTVASHVDVRGDGGYVVAPYSTHESGKHYAWVGGYGAIEKPLAPFPENVLKLLGAPNDGFIEVKTGPQEPWVTELLKGVKDGQKHQALIRLCGYFSAKGLPLDVAKTILLDWNARNETPAEPSGVIERIEDVYRRYPQNRVVASGTHNMPGVSATATAIRTPKTAVSGFLAGLGKGAKSLPTGFHQLDRITGGLHVGNVAAIGAWPGVGKTAFTLGLARRLAEAGYSVAYFPTEMAHDEVMQVFVSSGLQIPFARVRAGELSGPELSRIEQYMTGPLLEKLHIVENNAPTLEDIVKVCNELKPQVMVLDYLQHTKGTLGDTRRDIAQMVMGIKGLAKELQMAAIVTSQFSRPKKDDEGNVLPPTMFDFSESAQIEREVSMALLMSPTEERETAAMEFPVHFNVAKNRFGKVGEFELKFNQEFVSFAEA